MNKFLRMFSVLLMCVFFLSGCGQGKDTSSQKDSDEKFTIITSFYPLYLSAINIARDIPDVQVINMTKPETGCLHDYQLTPEDLKTLEKADAFVINGAGMESFMDKVIKQQKNLKIVEAARGIEIIKNGNGELNPHVWVSISDNIQEVRNISSQMAEIDVVHAEKYKSNADSYVKKLEELKDKMRSSLDNVKNRDIITFHEAFPYFAKEFNLNIAAVIEREPDTAPTPKELEKIIGIVKDSGIKALFAEPQYSAKAAETIATETGAKVYALDPVVTGEAKPDGYDEYINIMEKNLKSLIEALK